MQENNNLRNSVNELSRALSSNLVNGTLNREIARPIAEALRSIRSEVREDQIPELIDWLASQKIDEFYALERARYANLKGVIRINLSDLSFLEEFFRTAYALVVLNPDLVIEINSEKGSEQRLAKISGQIRNEFKTKISAGSIRSNPPVNSAADVAVNSNSKAQVVFDATSFPDGRPVPKGVAAAALLTAASLLKEKVVDGVEQDRVDGMFRWQDEFSVEAFGARGIVAVTQAQETARKVFQRAA